MFLGKEKEERRSQIWRITVVIATITIVSISAYFLHKMFTHNPIVGTWSSQTRDTVLTIHEDGEIEIAGGEIDIVGNVIYNINIENKTISFTLREGNYLEGSDLDKETNATFTNTYTYSIEQEILTLTDMEFGEQENFIRL